jgi:hypothetical protein
LIISSIVIFWNRLRILAEKQRPAVFALAALISGLSGFAALEILGPLGISKHGLRFQAIPIFLITSAMLAYLISFVHERRSVFSRLILIGVLLVLVVNVSEAANHLYDLSLEHCAMPYYYEVMTISDDIQKSGSIGSINGESLHIYGMVPFGVALKVYSLFTLGPEIVDVSSPVPGRPIYRIVRSSKETDIPPSSSEIKCEGLSAGSIGGKTRVAVYKILPEASQ